MANEKNPDQGLIDFIARGLKQTINGVVQTNWFGPGTPLLPVAPDDTLIRILDYMYGINLIYEPGTTQEIEVPFTALRYMADNCDILRLAIETRKDQVAKIPWSWRVRSVDGESNKVHAKRNANDPRIKMLNNLFRYPDGERDWGTCVRGWLEEVFVTDALSLAPRWSTDQKSGFVGVDQIDGSLISRKIDVQGRTPFPPSVAYQQFIKGVPAIDLTTRDLIYRPRNYRPHKVYGFSPTQQILTMINIALRRQSSQLYYFTEGNVPEMLITAPKSWSPQALKQLQDQFDVLKGNQRTKQRVRFIPGGEPGDKVEVIPTKDKILMNEMDEWIARIICYAFSLSPQPFVKMMNRATAQNAAEQALQEGLAPLLDWMANLLTFIAEKYIGFDDIEFAFLDDEEADQLKQAQIDKIYLAYGKVSVDELRERDGEDPIGMGPAVFTPTGPIPLKPFLNGGPMADGMPQHTNPQQPQPKGSQPKIAAPVSEAQVGNTAQQQPTEPTQKMTKFRKKWKY